MNPIELLRLQLDFAHQVVEGTMSDVTPEQAHWMPPGIATPLGASYAHVVLSEDLVVNGMLRQGAPLMATSWAGRTGLSEPMPMPGPEWVGYAGWNRRVQVDLPAMKEYAQAVYVSTNEYLSGLTPEDLDTPVDLTGLGFGPSTVGWVLSALLIGHVNNIAGEISCLKGLQGAKGYPF
ncbi:MAG: hypothetical protein QOH93_177 [Chloroflexia bacterium]|jgi:hypothetical protein|nr:hypothetical protein [Chloroflexia bacterium]